MNDPREVAYFNKLDNQERLNQEIEQLKDEVVESLEDVISDMLVDILRDTVVCNSDDGEYIIEQVINEILSEYTIRVVNK